MSPVHLNRIPGSALAASGAVLWGTVGVAVKYLYAIEQTDEMTVGFLRLLISVPFLYVLEFIFTKKEPLQSFLRLRTKQVYLLLGAGICIAGYQLLLFSALIHTQVSTAIIIDIGSSPVIAALIAWPLLSEKPTPAIGLCILGAVIGVALVSDIHSISGLLAGSTMGSVLALGAGFAYALYSVLTRALLNAGVSPWHVATMTFLGGTLFLLPFAVTQGLLLPKTPLGWGILLYLGIVPTAVAYVFWTFGLRTTLVSVATTIALCEPLTATFLAVILLNDTLNLVQIAGALLLLSSIYGLSKQRS